jgi:uncharacterized protein
LLQELYGTIIIPQAVYQELTSAGDTIPGATEVQTFNWIQVQQATNRTLVNSLLNQLHQGESEAIALAIELQADWLLIDEELGRKVAANNQLKFTGILGILIEAKQRGLIPSVKSVLDNLINQAEFWVNEALYNRVLQMAGE